MKLILVTFLSCLSTNCGAQERYESHLDKGRKEIDKAQNEWIYDRAVDVAKTYRSLMYGFLTNSNGFKIDNQRCVEDTLCMDLFEIEDARAKLFESLLVNYNVIENYRTIYDVCENYRVKLKDIKIQSETLSLSLEKAQKRLKNIQMSDVLQFGGQIDNIKEYLTVNTLTLAKLNLDIKTSEFMFGYIYPSEKYETYLVTRDNPLKQR